MVENHLRFGLIVRTNKKDLAGRRSLHQQFLGFFQMREAHLVYRTDEPPLVQGIFLQYGWVTQTA